MITTLTWALSLVLNNYSVLKNIQVELDIYVGKERRVNQFDLNKLTYLRAVVKETLRLYPPAPLLLPHESTDDCVVNGYNIRKDPNTFRPERFLMNEHKEIDVRGNHFELIPFGSGRRICPGVSLSLQVVELSLASLIHGFDLKRISDELIDMTESAGIVNVKATPLYVFLSPSLPSHLYN
nr:cytochrome P450 CYP82D47-like [Ipomoea batatas]